MISLASTWKQTKALHGTQPAKENYKIFTCKNMIIYAENIKESTKDLMLSCRTHDMAKLCLVCLYCKEHAETARVLSM